MKQTKNIKDLKITLKKLYNNDCQINIHFSDKPFIFHIVLKNHRDEIDCKLSSFGANLWTRTNFGLKYKKYKRIQDLQTAIKKEINKKIETNGEIFFSLSNEIFYF